MKFFAIMVGALLLAAALLYIPIKAFLEADEPDAEYYGERVEVMAEAETNLSSPDRSPPSVKLEEDPPDGKSASFEDMPHYRPGLAGRYQAYSDANPGMDIYGVVTYVNIGLDYPFYENVSEIENPDDILVLCNKYHRLPATYVPKGLALTGGRTLKKEARDAFELMRKAAKQAGRDLYISNSYRSYDSQKQYYDDYVKNEMRGGLTRGEATAEADEYSARPGHSEHQTALTFDLRTRGTTGSLSSIHYEETAEYAWLIENAHLYGYILRYPECYEHITGYTYEPWHWRYIGVDAATEMCEKGIATLEEYLATMPES